MGNYRKWISLALSAVMAISLAACGGGSGSEGGNGGNGGNGGGQTSEAVDVNCVYSAEQLMLDSGEDLTDLTLNTLRYVDNYIYASGYSYSDFGEGSHVLLKFSPAGDDVEVGYMMSGAAEDVLATCIGADGNFYVVRAAYDDDLMGLEDEGADLGSTMSEGPAPADEPDSEDDEGAAVATEPDEDTEISGEDVIEDADDEFVPIDGNEDGPVDIGEEVTDEGSPVNAEGAETAPDGSAVSDEEGEEGDGSTPGGFDDDEIEDYTSAGEASPADEEAEESTDGITSPLDEYGDDPEIDAEDELTAETVDEVDGSVADSEDTSYVIACVNYEGEELWRAPCGSKEQSEDEMYYVNAIAYSEDGLIVADAKGLQLYSKEDGSFIRTIGEGENYSGCTPIVLPDGTAAVHVFGGNGDEIDKLNLETGELSGNYKIPAEIGFSSVMPGSSDYPLYLVGSSAVYGFNLDESAPVKILDFVDSDLDIMGINSMVDMGDHTFASVIVDSDGMSSVEILRQVDPEIVANRKTLTLGCYYLDYEVRKQVFAYNKESQEARISIVDYSKFDSDEGMEGLTKLNTDIASGSAPDILLLSGSMPVNSYVSKGVFEDLTSYFDGDEEISGNQYLNNILDAFKTEGKMYTIVPSFYAISTVGKTSDIGDGSGFTLDLADELAKKTGVDKGRMFGLTTRDTMLYQAMEMCGDQFIDWDKAACSFDSPEFIRLLEFIAQFPAGIDENNTEDTSADYRSGKSLFYPDTMGGFDEYTYLKYGVFGTDITMAGYPAQTPGSAVIMPQLEIAVNSSSEEKDACWSFVRRFLLSDYQETIDMYWPISVSALDRLAEKAKEPVYYMDENGSQVEDFITVNIGGEEIKLPRVTEEEAASIKAFLGSLNRTAFIDNNVENIIAEEAAAFFEGQKSAEDVASVIQSRVKIYINENS